MSSWFQGAYHALLVEVRLGLRFVAFYLLPWAKVCDFLTTKLVLRRRGLQPFFWYISACMMASIVGLHFATLWLVIYVNHAINGGHEAVPPCVCEATMQHAMHTHALIPVHTGNFVLDLVTLIRTCGLLLFQLVSILVDVLNVWLHRPVTCVSSVVFLLVVRNL